MERRERRSSGTQKGVVGHQGFADRIERPCEKISSSFSLTLYLPFCSSGCLPTFSLWPRNPLLILACIRRATPI